MAGEVRILDRSPSLLSQYLAEIRDEGIQQDRLRFRRNIERIGEIMALEISRELAFAPRKLRTPLAQTECEVLAEQPVLAAILRAALPFHQGLLNFFDGADNAFISAYRRHLDGSDDFDVHIEYLSSPSLEGRTLILCDPMLATGSSMVLAWNALLQRGTPARLHVASVIASEPGVAYAREHLPGDTVFWMAAIDPVLNDRAYIVPGLGDAGDLAYGGKD
jgi:uracil phosphoribosyltransferase